MIEKGGLNKIAFKQIEKEQRKNKTRSTEKHGG